MINWINKRRLIIRERRSYAMETENNNARQEQMRDGEYKRYKENRENVNNKVKIYDKEIKKRKYGN